MNKPTRVASTAQRAATTRSAAPAAAATTKRAQFATLFARSASEPAPMQRPRPADAAPSASAERREADVALRDSSESSREAVDSTPLEAPSTSPSQEFELAAAAAALPGASDALFPAQIHFQGLSEVVEFALLVKDARGVHHLQFGVTTAGAGAQMSYDVQLAALGNGRVALKVRGPGGRDRAALDAQRELARRLRARGLEVVEEDEAD